MKSRSWFWSGLIVAAALVLGVVYSQLSPSKKRYLQYMSQQFPHMLSRYFV